MAVAFRSSSSTTYASRTNTTITAPTGIANGDILIIWFLTAAATAPTPTTPTGFTLVSGFPTTNTVGGFNVKGFLFYKVAASESGDYTITHVSTTSQGYMAAFSGGDTSNPLNPAPTKATGTGATSTATGLTTASNNSAVIFLEHDWGDTTNALSAPTGTTPTFTKRLGSSATSIMLTADGILATAGATGNKSITNNNLAPSAWAAVLVAINAASSGSVVTNNALQVRQAINRASTF